MSLLKEALETQILVLESVSNEDSTRKVCINCWELVDFCACITDRRLWPIELAIERLRWILETS